MNWFLKHIPNFVEVESEPQRIPFETTADLLEVGAVKRAATWPGFLYYAVSENRLMVVCSQEWWVIGYIDDPGAVDLPKWCPP